MKHLLHTILVVFLTILGSNTAALAQNKGNSKLKISYKNPVTSQFDLNLKLSERMDLTLSIEDLKGKQVKFLMRQELVAGEHSMPFVVSGIATGDYKLKIETANSTDYQDLKIRNLATPQTSGNYGNLTSNSNIKGLSFKMPNPIKSGDHISLKLEETMPVKLFLENMKGDFAKPLLDQELMKGEHEIVVVTSDLAAGNYRIQLETPKGSMAKVLTVRDLNPNMTNIGGKNLSGIYAVPMAANNGAVKVDFKNPVRSGDELKIKVNSLGSIKMFLEDKEGKFMKLLMNQELMVGEHSVPVIVSDIPAGSYTLKIETFDGVSERSFRVTH